ncbi:MAG: extracellular solute-binding protein [Solirubrobacterales bacterium]
MRRLAILAPLLAALVSACGGSGGSIEQQAAVPAGDVDEPATGTLRVFAYEDSVTEEMMAPFEAQNPGLTVKTATFDSDAEAAAKLAGGFSADVVEVCLDEATPLLDRGLLRPLDTEAVTEWDEIAFHEAEGVRDEGGAIMAPLSAGPHGVIYNTEEIDGGIDSYADLYDPAYEGRTAIEGDYALPPVAVSALATGVTDPMNMDAGTLAQVGDYMDENRAQFRALWGSDSDLVNLYKSGEVVISDGNSGLAARIEKAGVPIEWVAPKEGTLSWVCGFGITSKADNLDAAYRLINWQASPEAQAIRGESGYVVTNPAAVPLIDKANRATADPSSLDDAIPETYPPIYDDWVRTFEAFRAG